jgi:membrane peptidoglycan carboxypeptidase
MIKFAFVTRSRAAWRPLLLALGACVLYLLIAACWAWASFDEAMAHLRVLPEAQLSPRQIQILTLVEDPDFFEHAGVSLGAGQGLATISSALARDVYLSGADLAGVAGVPQRLYRAVFACCKKVDLGRDVMAVVLNARLSKEQQLAAYVSSVYMGRKGLRQLRGLPQAARSYLGKRLDETTDEEFIGLVAMIKGPNQFHPTREPLAYATRVARVHALVAGSCRPAGWFDTSLAHCGQAVHATPGRSR